MKKIIGMGNALVDIMTSLKDDNLLNTINFPKGSMQLVDQKMVEQVESLTSNLNQTLAPGGSAANTIRGLALLGASTSYIGCTGNDETGKYFYNGLKALNINPVIFKGTNSSGRAIAMVSPDSERTFATYLGAAIELNANHISKDIFKNHHYFHIEGYLVQNHDLLETAVHHAKAEGLIICLDLASFNVVEDNLEFLQHIIKEYVDIVFANEDEAKAFTGQAPEQALDTLASQCNIAIVKIGSEGSLIKSGNKQCKVAPIGSRCIDTTGAGDLYASGFIYGLTLDLPLEKCGKLGSLMAGEVIAVLGASIPAIRWNHIKESVQSIINQ